MSDNDNTIKTPVETVKKNGVLIFGGGLVGKTCLRYFNSINVPVVAFLDNNKPLDQPIANTPVHRPRAVPATVDKSLPVVISVWRVDVGQKEIRDDLRDAGFTNVMTLATFVRSYFREFGDFYYNTPEGFYDEPENLRQIEFVKELWADRLSSDTYDYLLKIRKHFDDTSGFAGSPDEYYPADIPSLLKSPMRYVDVGAYDGAILEIFLKLGVTIESSVLFEPSLNNYKNLVRNVTRANFPFPTALYPCALGDKEEVLRFHQDDIGEASKATDAGDTHVTSVPLDSAIQNFKPTYVKLDVEGAELSVLKGGVKTIAKHRPNLAVCLYHKARDLFEIPYWFHSNFKDLGYKYYLRQHSNGLDSHCFYVVG
ncbi:MAG: FkbM family methyltransferase [Deltaproteobacteria bacterium]|jgi:FkbM family methyltransferase|nr:FkbM family methyltransferase [Deltaproteobacteria bacterium]